MKPLAFQRLKQQIINNDDRGLRTVFEQGADYCIRTLLKKTNCDPADAEDIFMDALLIFRENICSGRLTELTNLRTYLFGICWNRWRDLHRAEGRRQRARDEMYHQLERLLDQEGESWTPDEQERLQQQAERQLGIALKMLEQLGDKCRQLWTFIEHGEGKEAEGARLLGLANANVVKVTKHRCYQKWRAQIDQALAAKRGG
jgi:DNA-directed RNA polymerase specialized sigma24 family protein